MLGAIIGDVVGSRFEFHNIRSKDFVFFHPDCFFTDDTVMTCAAAQALLDAEGDPERLKRLAVSVLHDFGNLYPGRGYGGRFSAWLDSPDPKPYHSFGNGAAMRGSPVGWAAKTEEEAKRLSRIVTEITHDHPEGLRGAEAVAMCIFLAREGKTNTEIRNYVDGHYFRLDFSLSDIRDTYGFDETCQESVPQAITAFLESEGFEDSVRNAVSIGGDSDTIAAIAGSIAEARYGIPEDFRKLIFGYLDDRLSELVRRFENLYPPIPGRM